MPAAFCCRVVYRGARPRPGLADLGLPVSCIRCVRTNRGRSIMANEGRTLRDVLLDLANMDVPDHLITYSISPYS